MLVASKQRTCAHCHTLPCIKAECIRLERCLAVCFASEANSGSLRRAVHVATAALPGDAVMSPPGTKRTSRDVCLLVCFRCEADRGRRIIPIISAAFDSGT